MKSKQVLDVQQMQHLQGLGLKLDYNTVLSWIIDERGKDKPLLCISSEAVDYVDFSHYCLPAYTLQDILDLLPNNVDNELFLFIEKGENKWRIGYTDKESEEIFEDFSYEELIDAAYALLCWAIENKFVETNKRT